MAKGEGVSGGACYSGVGSDGAGGSDGVEGCCGSASGEGSGLDLSSIQLENFALSAGAGGKKFLTAGGKQAGIWWMEKGLRTMTMEISTMDRVMVPGVTI